MKVVCHSGGHFYYKPNALECLYLALNSFLVTCGLGLRPNAPGARRRAVGEGSTEGDTF